MATQYIAYTVKGLENIAASEIKELISDAAGISVAEKRVIFSSNSPIKQTTKLKTVDDIQLLLGSFPKPASLDDLFMMLKSIDLQKAQETLRLFRTITTHFSITYGAVKTDDFNTTQAIDAIKNAIETTYHWHYTEKEHTNFDIRIFIDQTYCVISARITKESLHHRKYKQFEKPGSLRPTVAAAMVRLASKKTPQGKLVDNFCGSGTILCEARNKEIEVFGGDIDPESVLFTKKNLANSIGVPNEQIRVLDATHTPWPASFFDAACSNLPYGKQIPLPHITKLYEQTIQEYNRITKSGGTICLLLTNPELMNKYVKLHIPSATIQTYQLGFTGQTPTIIVIKK